MKLFVGNLPFSVESEDLKRIFEDAGVRVDSATVVEDRMTQRSRGFGFVETPDGQQAIDAMSGKQIDGRALTVNEARPMADRAGFGGGRGGNRGGGGGRRDRY